MTNRFLTRPAIDFSTRSFGHSYRLAGQQYLDYCYSLDQNLLELENRNSIVSHPEYASQQKIKTIVITNDDSHIGSRLPELATPTYDQAEFNAEEVDVRWI